MRHKSLPIILILSVILTDPITGQNLKCVRHCDEVPGTELDQYVHFFPGKTHLYHVQVVNTVQVEYNRSRMVQQHQQVVEENLIQIDAEAKIVPLNQCEMLMKLDKIDIKFFNMASGDRLESIGNSKLEIFLEKLTKPILFGYKDGIVTDICFGQDDQEDEPYVINVKKSIISALQTAPKILLSKKNKTIQFKVTETDYHGECQTDYNVTFNDQSEIVTKHKDLLQCIGSSDDFPDLGTLLKQSKRAESKCEQQISASHLIRVQCRSERSLDTMMTNFGIDLVSGVNLTELEIRDSIPEDRNVSVVTEWNADQPIRSLDHRRFNHHEIKSETSRDDLKSILIDLCDDIRKQNRIGSGTPKIVHRLADAFRTATIDDVNFLFQNEIQSGNICQDQSKKLNDLFVDTAATLMSDSTGGLIRDQLLKLVAAGHEDPIAQQRARFLAITMAFARDPSQKVVQDIIPELFEKIFDAEILLSISSMVPRVDDHSSGMESLKERIYANLLNFVASPKTIQGLPEVDTVRLFKALENVAPSSGAKGQQEKFIPIINGDQYPEMIRFAAIKSLDKIPISNQVRQALLAIVANPAELTEIRIIAYRTLINTGSSAEELQKILEIIKKEKSENSTMLDVYNYVCSHQKMLRTTGDQSKHSILPQEAPQFPEPISLFSQPFISRHFEYSLSGLAENKIPNVQSMTIETDVIMSGQNGTVPIPRMLIINATIPVPNGHQTIPLVELIVRQDGLEKQFENLIQQVVSQKKYRTVRHLFSRFDEMIPFGDTESNSRLQVLISIDGRSMFAYDSRDPRNNLWDIYEKLKQQKFPIQIDETTVVMPLKYRVPVVSPGSVRPLFLEVNTTYIASFEGKMIDSNQTNDWFEMMIKPTIISETAAGLRSDFDVEKFQFSNQIVIAPTLHVKTRIEDDQKLTVKFILPEKEQTWFRSQTRMIRNNEKKSFSGDQIETKCIDSMRKLFGISFCHKKLSPSNAKELIDYSALTLVKDSEHMEGIELTVELPKQIFSPINIPVNSNRIPFGFAISTPGSYPEKRFETRIIFNIPNGEKDYLLVEYGTQILERKWYGQLVATDNQQDKSIKFEMKNEKDEHLLAVELSGPIGQLDWKNVTLQFQAKSKTFPDVQGIFSYQQEDSGTSKMKINLDDGKPLVDVSLAKKCPENSSNQCQISWSAKVEFGQRFKINHTWLYHSYGNEMETIKSIHHLSYNRFWSRSSKIETIDIKASRIISNNSSKRLIHYEQFLSQFPMFDLVLEHNEKHQLSIPEIFSTESFVKYGQQQQQNLIRLNQRTKIVNQTDQTTRYDTEIYLDIRPKNLNYKINNQLDYTVSKSGKLLVIQTKIQDKIQKMILDSNFRYEQQSSKPYRSQTIGEMKLFDENYILAYKDHVEESTPGKFHGKFESDLILKDENSTPKWLPKRSVIQYRFETNENSDHDGHTIPEMLINFRKFEYQLFAENDHFGHCGQMGQLEINSKIQVRNVLRCEGEEIYQFSGQYENRSVKISLDTSKLDELHLDGNFHWNLQNQSYLLNLTVKNQNFNHETMIDIESLKLESINSKTKHLDRKFLAIKYDGPKRMFEFGLDVPKYEFEHETRINLDSKDGKSVQVFVLKTQTRHHYRNVLQFDFHSEPYENGTNRFEGKFGGDLVGTLSMGIVPGQEDLGYQFHLDIKAPQKRFMHESKARWTRFLIPDLVDVKNLFGIEQNLLDFHYERNPRQQNSIKFDHQMMVSTRSSMVQMYWLWPIRKASFDFKTKSFGGIDHHTDFDEINLPTLKFTSETWQNDLRMKIVADLELANGQESNATIILGNNDDHRIYLEILPMKSLKIETDSKNGWKGFFLAKRTAPDHLIVEINGKNQLQRGTDFRLDLVHQCNRYTQIETQFPSFGAKLDHDVQRKTLDFDLKGFRHPLKGLDHRTHAKWDHNLEIRSETKQNDQRLVWVDIMENSEWLKCNFDSDLERFPVAFRSMFKTGGRHIDLEAIDKCHNRHLKFENKIDDWNDFRFDCSWGEKHEPTAKRIRLAVHQDQPSDGVSGQIEAQWFEHQVSGRINLKKHDDGSIAKGNHLIQARYINLETNNEKSLNAEHRYKNDGYYQTKIECLNGPINVLTGNVHLDCHDENSMNFSMSTKTDLWDLLNSDVKFQNDIVDDGGLLKQNCSIRTGTIKDRENLIFFNGKNNGETMEFTGKFLIPWISDLEQTAKLEWNKRDRRLQMNIYNSDGRLIDVNIDLFAKALRKKFQIVSFVDLIPTVDAEAVFGEDSYLVLALSFRQQKKLELNMKWFGQWRQDYRAEILFRCFTYPEFEMMMVSHHPALFDKIDLMIKYRRNQEDRTTERKTVQLSLERRFDNDSKQEIVTYEGKLNGDEFENEIKANVLKTVGQINKIEIDIEKSYRLQLYYRYRKNESESSMIKTGVAILQNQTSDPVFVAMFIEPPPPMNDPDSIRTITMGQLYLPGNIDYRMINDVTFENLPGGDRSPKQIHSIITRGKETFAEIMMDFGTDLADQIIQIHLASPRFQRNPKSMILRYQLQPMTKRFQVILGDRDREDFIKPVSIRFEFLKKPITDGLNHSMIFSMESLAETNPYRSLNFTIMGHVSLRSLGFEYENINRYGDRKSGHWFLGLTEKKEVHFFHRCSSEKFPETNHVFGAKFQPSNIRKTLDIDAKFEFRNWLTAENIERIESFSLRKDLCEWRVRIWRQLRQEIQHKWMIFKHNHVDRELVMKIWEEFRFVRHRMNHDSEGREIIRIVDLFLEDYQRIYSKINIDRYVEEFLNEIDRFFENFSENFYRKMKKSCNEHDVCRKIYQIIWKYEAKRAVKRMIEPIMDNRYFPETLKTMVQETIGNGKNSEMINWKQVKENFHDLAVVLADEILSGNPVSIRRGHLKIRPFHDQDYNSSF